MFPEFLITSGTGAGLNRFWKKVAVLCNVLHSFSELDGSSCASEDMAEGFATVSS
jgi:hypothetical protein